MANDDLHKSLSATEKEQVSASILLLNNAIEQLTQEQSAQKEQTLKLLDDAIEKLTKEQATQKAKALEILDNAIKKLSQQQLSQKEKILKRLDNAIKKLSSVEYSRPKDSVFKRLYNFFIRPKQTLEEPSTPAIPHFFDDFSMQDALSSDRSTSDHQPSPGITIEIDLEDIEKDALYGIPLQYDIDEDATDTSTNTDPTQSTRDLATAPPPIINTVVPTTTFTPPVPRVDNSTTTNDTNSRPTPPRDTAPPPIINTVVPNNTFTPPVPRVDNSTTTNDTNSRTTPPRDTTPPPIINTVMLTTPTTPIPPIPKGDHTQITTTQDIASSSVASNFLPPYLQRQKQQEKIGNKIININLIEYLHNKELKKSNKFNNHLNNNQQLHEAKYSTGENSQVFKFNENAANIYKNVKVSDIATASQQSFEVSNNLDSKVKVSLVEKPNISKLVIQSQSDNSTDLMLSITMETKKQLGSKANIKIYIDENTNEQYIKELIEVLAKSISLGLNIQLLPPKNKPHPEQYNSIITSVIDRANATAPKIDPRLLPTQLSNRR